MLFKFIGIVLVFILVFIVFSYVQILPIFTDKTNPLYDKFDVLFITIIFILLVTGITVIAFSILIRLST